MSGCWLVVLLLAAPAGAPVELRARLTVEATQPAVGQPVRLRLELTNAGNERITYQAAHLPVSEVLDVWLPGGRPAPYIHGSTQTGEEELSLDPGRTAVLLDGFDLAEHYHLPYSGRYRVQFSGRALELSRNARAPVSNVVEIDLRPGRRPAATEVVERLLPVVPKGWQLTRTAGPGKIEVLLSGLVRSTQDQARVTLWLTDRQPIGEARVWGQTEWGKLWIFMNAKARAAWPSHRRAIIGSLGVRPDL